MKIVVMDYGYIQRCENKNHNHYVEWQPIKADGYGYVNGDEKEYTNK